MHAHVYQMNNQTNIWCSWEACCCPAAQTAPHLTGMVGTTLAWQNGESSPALGLGQPTATPVLLQGGVANLLQHWDSISPRPLKCQTRLHASPWPLCRSRLQLQLEERTAELQSAQRAHASLQASFDDLQQHYTTLRDQCREVGAGRRPAPGGGGCAGSLRTHARCLQGGGHEGRQRLDRITPTAMQATRPARPLSPAEPAAGAGPVQTR